MKRRIIFLLNPIAGTGNKSRIGRLIEKKLTAAEVDFEIYPTNGEGNYSAIRTKILHEGVTDIVVAGGDGTISSVVHNLRDTHVNFGLIPCGSGNGLAFCAGISKNPRRAIDLIFTGTPVLTDAFTINNNFSCMLSGLGFDAQVAHDFAKQNRRGLLTYIRQTYSNFLKATPYHFEISANDTPLFTEAFFISIANSNQFGNRFTIAPKANLNDGLLDIVIVQKMNKPHMLLAVLRQIRMGKVNETHYKKEGIIYYQTKHLHIKNPDLAPLHIDGDPKPTASSFDIRVVPDAFRLIRPSARRLAKNQSF
ncbi:diacylglycerol/lipid kinase family protein [Agriterribacter sp.]|uniref:diacylglycerol/lipid kinase family protein n=1 Tax=Agriterribacter sp. TaxID=2821509 RepID=UPI002C2F6AD8|nr:YegS/Rv2252/BmrU family lipid kinase [Agriterribacter sp.]HTN07055.1 YegS/Rv2252/BmrU family lipid kinase [Agriterribacter sp.]